MADGWLPEGFENQDVTAPGRLAGRVALQVEGHRRRVRILRGGMALTALALLLGAAPTLWRSFREAPQPAPQQVAQLKVEKPTWAPENNMSNVEGRKSDVEGSKADARAATPSAPDSLNIRHSPSDIPHSSPDISIQKAPKGVELAWTGSAEKEYVVYRCTSPKFDQCSVAGTVKGNQWNDTGSDSAPVVFYKVEPKV
jgi:hypothetical protein